MPNDRFLHRRLWLSRKVNALDDQAARVWSHGYLLAADDFGVMPNEVGILMSSALTFRDRPAATLRLALDQIIAVDLVLVFEHEGRHYLCDRLWQDFQHIRWPRQTLYPCPTSEVLRKFSGATLKLFRNNHERFPADFGGFTERLPRNFTGSRAETPTQPQANGKRLTANGSGEEGSGEKPHPIRDVLASHETLFTLRFGVKPAPYTAKDATQVKRLLGRYGQDEVLALVREFFDSADPFIQQCGYGLGALVSQVNKLIAARATGVRGAQAEADRAVALLRRTKRTP